MKRKSLLLLLPILILFSGCILITGCSNKNSTTKEATNQKKDFLIGTWFAKSSSYNGESRNPEDVFGGTFYLYFNEKGECTMAIDQQRAILTWERTKEGVTLIKNQLLSIFSKNSIKPMTINEGDEFNTDYHEAVSVIDAGEDMKGKIVAVTDTGYTYSDKVLRYAKVVVGQ